MELLSSRERKFIEDRLRSQYDIEDFENLILIKAGRGRIRATTEETLRLASRLKGVQQIGLYVMKISDGSLALSVEGSQLLNKKIRKNIVEVDEDLAIEWMKASPIKLDEKVGGRYVVARCGELYLGSGRVSRDGKIYPQIAKWRRIPES